METTEFTKYHKDGSVWVKGHLAGDEMHGYWEWFRMDGSRMRSGWFDHGARVGEWVTYDRSSRPHTVTNFTP
jgi:antitoxin component YwqK of YwqJK toxin-antitoxin module